MDQPIPRRIELIEESDLQNLVDQRVREGRRLEYKRELPGRSDREKIEFLADVSALANTHGGDLCFGIDEEEGEAVGLRPIVDVDIDQAVTRLESILRTGLDPKLPGVQVRPVPVGAGFVVVVRVARSWAAPHMVVSGGQSRFFGRHSTGKYQLDVRELRLAFNASAAIESRVRNFRSDRIRTVQAPDAPLCLREAPRIFLHLLPMELSIPGLVDLRSIYQDLDRLRPLSSHGMNYRPNLDGYLVLFEDPTEGRVLSYTQVFRNGAIEFVDTILPNQSDSGGWLPVTLVEERVIDAVTRGLEIQEKLQSAPPTVVALTMVGVKNYELNVPNRIPPLGQGTIDRDRVELPEVLAEDHQPDVPTLLRPMFEALWNAAGWPRSMNYDEAGQRIATSR